MESGELSTSKYADTLSIQQPIFQNKNYNNNENNNSINEQPFSWKQIHPSGVVPLPRHCHSACLYQKSYNRNFVIIFGGYSNENNIKSIYLCDIQIFSIEENKWRSLKPQPSVKKPEGRHSHTTITYKGKMYLYGGISQTGVLSDLWALNLSNFSWKLIENPILEPPGRWAHSAVVYLGSMVIFGGFGQELRNDVWQFDFETSKWKNLTSQISGSIPEPRQYCSLVSDEQTKKIYLISGYGKVNYSDIYILYDLKTWILKISNHPLLSRRGHISFLKPNTNFFLKNENINLNKEGNEENLKESSKGEEDILKNEKGKQIFIFGGRGKENALNDIVFFNLENNTGKILKLEENQICPSPRYFHSGVLFQNQIITFAGFSQTLNQNDLYSFNLDETRNDIKKNLLQGQLKDMINNPLFSDLNFLIDDKIIYAHKNILYCRSEHFKALISNSMRESLQNTIQIQEIRSDIFLLILEYIYTDEIQNIKQQNIIHLLEAADRFLLTDLKRLIENLFLESLTSENVSDFKIIAEQYSLKNLFVRCLHLQ